MKALLAIAAAALLAACAQVSTETGKVEKKIDQGFAKADAFVVAKIKPTVVEADDWLKAKLGPSLEKASDAFFHNKWAAQSVTVIDGHHDGETRGQ